MPLNLTTILVAALVFICSLGAVGWKAHSIGYSSGVAYQKVEDQKQFDTYNAQTAANKMQANNLYRETQSEIIALKSERDIIKNSLENQYVEHQEATRILERKYAASSLRFATTEDTRPRADCTSTKSSEGNTSSTTEASIIQLPDPLTRELRQLTSDADQLADDYRLCYAYVKSLR